MSVSLPPSAIADPARNRREAHEALAAAEEWSRAGKGVALATVIATWGSSPCPPGSLLAINGEGSFVGSVSGGCIEGAVIAEAGHIIRDGGTRMLDFGVSDDEAWTLGLACGGSIRIYLERLD